MIRATILAPIIQDMAWWFTGRDTNYLMTYMRWFSTEPFTDQSFLSHTPEQTELDKLAQKLTNIKAQEAMTRTLVRYITDNALVIPVYDPPSATMQQPYVHSTQYEQAILEKESRTLPENNLKWE